ncbi:MAG: dTDP-4-dehydrorhamnose reductase [Acidimicrobiaceae bacterium]|nr:dTDP-4-dehydrorhamnose reductase [Acidimicrobiia bacterium]MCY4494163.1 dTDP-4-dehydrorhamnose reductase [Acidimicrobiaceae bacterium]
MKVFVTGAGGQLGSDLVRLLDGHEAITPDRSELDVTDSGSVAGAMLQTKPDLVINCAAFTDVDRAQTDADRAFSTNATAVRILAEAAREIGAHFTTISTELVFDGTKSGPYTETDSPSPVSVYGQSKAEGERHAGTDATIVRTSWLCGETGHNMVKTILNLLDKDEPLRFVDDQIGHPTFTADLAPIVLELSLQRRPGIFHATNQGAVSWFQFARAVAAAAGEDPTRVTPCSTAELRPVRPAARPANGVLDNAALRTVGFAQTRDFREPLAELICRLR